MSQNQENKTRLVLLDIEQKKVGCVLLQAIYGGDRGITNRIDSRSWFTAPTETMKLYRVKEEDVEPLIDRLNELALHHEER